MTAVTAIPLFQALQAPAVDTPVYPSPLGARTLIDKFTGTNVSAGVVSLTVNIVASGGAAGTANIISQTVAIAAGATYTFPEIVGHVLNPGDFISIKASAAASINVRGSGRQVTGS